MSYDPERLLRKCVHFLEDGDMSNFQIGSLLGRDAAAYSIAAEALEMAKKALGDKAEPLLEELTKHYATSKSFPAQKGMED